MRKPNKEELTIPQPLLIVAAAAEVGLLQTLAKMPLNPEEAAQKTNTDLRAAKVILNALVALGYVREDGEKYALSGEAQEMFYSDKSPNFTGFSFMHAYQLTKSWIKLPEVIKSGKPVPRTPENIPHFMGAMEHYAKTVAPKIVPLVIEGIKQPFKVLDVGGGPGIYAREFAKHGATVTILDEKPIVEMMSPKVDMPNINYVEGDFNVKLPDGEYDVAFLGNITHILDAEGNIALFKKVANVLSKGGRIAILDIVRDMSPRGALFAVNMLVNTEKGGTWTKAEYLEWLKESGFINTRVIDLKDRQIILGEKS